MSPISSAGRIQPSDMPRFMPVSSEAYSDIQQFLIYEALLLDRGYLDQWASLCAANIAYTVTDRSAQLLGRDLSKSKILGRDSLWACLQGGTPGKVGIEGTDNQRVIRRFVSNVSVGFGESATEYRVVSHVRASYAQEDTSMCSAWSGERHDYLRLASRANRAFLIARRELLIDWFDPRSLAPSIFV